MAHRASSVVWPVRRARPPGGFSRSSQQRTGDAVWLERARAFAMHAIEQVQRFAERTGQTRHSLWTGDIGVALYLRDCLDGQARYPTLDVF